MIWLRGEVECKRETKLWELGVENEEENEDLMIWDKNFLYGNYAYYKRLK